MRTGINKTTTQTHTILTGSQLQCLIDRFNLRLDLEDGVIVASRRDGKILKSETVAKMIGLMFTPDNWREEDGRVRGLQEFRAIFRLPLGKWKAVWYSVWDIVVRRSRIRQSGELA